MATGVARDEKEVFEFTIEPFVSGGYMLSIRYHGDCCHKRGCRPVLVNTAMPAKFGRS